jgi:hypothetical protein
MSARPWSPEVPYPDIDLGPTPAAAAAIAGQLNFDHFDAMPLPLREEEAGHGSASRLIAHSAPDTGYTATLAANSSLSVTLSPDLSRTVYLTQTDTWYTAVQSPRNRAGQTRCPDSSIMVFL